MRGLVVGDAAKAAFGPATAQHCSTAGPKKSYAGGIGCGMGRAAPAHEPWKSSAKSAGSMRAGAPMPMSAPGPGAGAYTSASAAGGYMPAGAAAGAYMPAAAAYSSIGSMPSAAFIPAGAAAGGYMSAGAAAGAYMPAAAAAGSIGSVPSAAAVGSISSSPSAAAAGYSPDGTAAGGYMPAGAAVGGYMPVASVATSSPAPMEPMMAGIAGMAGVAASSAAQEPARVDVCHLISISAVERAEDQLRGHKRVLRKTAKLQQRLEVSTSQNEQLLQELQVLEASLKSKSQEVEELTVALENSHKEKKLIQQKSEECVRTAEEKAARKAKEAYEAKQAAEDAKVCPSQGLLGVRMYKRGPSGVPCLASAAQEAMKAITAADAKLQELFCS